MSGLDRPDITPLLRAARDPEKLVTIAAGRALREFLRGEPVDYDWETPLPPPKLLVLPEVTTELWVPPLEIAQRLLSTPDEDWKDFGKSEIERLFVAYLSFFEESVIERSRLPERVATGALHHTWRVAWRASRAPVAQIVSQMAAPLRAPHAKTRWAAAQFVEEAVKFAGTPQTHFAAGPRSRHGEEQFTFVMAEPPPSVPTEPRDPDPRFADTRFFRDEEGNVGAPVPTTTILKAGRWYWLEVAVRVKPIGMPAEEQDRPIRPVKQKAPIEVLVTADSEDFEIQSRLASLTLPPAGDSIKQALFRVKPLAPGSAQIDVQLFYRFNLMEHLTLTAVVANAEETATNDVQKKLPHPLSREYVDLDEFVPRRMNINITRKDEAFQLRFVMNDDSGAAPVVLRARSTFTFTDLETIIEELRGILENLVLNDYMAQEDPGKFKFMAAVSRLAKFGRELWVSFFRKEPGSDLDKLGRALQDRPMGPGALIQVSMPELSAPFLFPWAVLYDQPLPDAGQPQDPRGFWGYRYAIEQQLPGKFKTTDEPRQIDDLMRIAFLLWEEFPNAPDQVQLMADLTTQAAPGLAVSNPPLIRRDDFYNAAKSSDSLLYFYAHGHTKRPKSGAQSENLPALVRALANQKPSDDPSRKSLEILAKRLEDQNSELDKSYIELSKGRLYYADILEKVETLSAEPFVFLNMCESVEMRPLASENFVSLFLGLGARAVLGTECTMTINFAHPFSRVFLNEVLRGEPLAEALLTARRYFLDNRNPLGLAYTLYGSGTLRFLPPRLRTEDHATTTTQPTGT